MHYKRNIERKLNEWKVSLTRKPLILRGARQVGKTTLIKEFSKKYDFSILLNLEKSSDITFFNKTDDVEIIVESLFITHNIAYKDRHKTLIFIDEIQESPEAIHLLRYFYEDLPELHIIAAGSLLEFAMSKVRSFPVGRVEYLYLHPLNFEEYLEAIQHEEAKKQLDQIPIRQIAHSALLSIFNQYAIIGGMPEIVKIALRNSIADLPKIYESIWESYINDVAKYASNNTDRKIIKHIISTAHLVMDQRIKFQNFGNSNYKSREVGEALRHLDDAKIIRLIYPSTDVNAPIKPNLRKSPRLQFLDTGLVNYALDIQAEMLGIKDLSNSYKGALIPHLITQELISLGSISNKKPCFWIREKNQSSSEVDLLFEYKNLVIPIEIKSGSKGSLRSLHQFVERTNHPYAIRIYGAEFNIEHSKTPGGTPYILMNMPYYLGTKIPEYVDYFITNYKLN